MPLDFMTGIQNTPLAGSITSPAAQSTGVGQVAGAVMGAIPLIGSSITSALNRSATQQANQANLDYAKWALQQSQNYSVQNWQMQADYNTPAAQVQRLRNAGLNPNLVYGSGSVTGNVASLPSPPQVQSYHAQPATYSDSSAAGAQGFAQIMQGLTAAAQANNLQALTTKVAAEAALIGAQQSATEAGTQKTLAEIPNVQADTDLKGAQVANLNLDGILKRAQTLNTQAETNKTNSLLAPQVANLNADTYLKAIEAQYDITRKQLDTALAGASIQDTAANIIHLKAMDATSVAERVKLMADVDTLRADTKLKQFDIDVNNAKISPQSAGWYYALFQVLENLGITKILPGIVGGYIGGKAAGGNRPTPPAGGSPNSSVFPRSGALPSGMQNTDF